MIKRILVALSGTPYTPIAVRYAIELAQRHDAELSGVTILDLERLDRTGPVPIGGASAAHALAEHRVEVTRERVEEQITAFEDACRDAGIKSCVYREQGDVMDELISCWRYHDLTVFGLRGMFEYGVVSNPDNQIVKMIAAGVRPILAVAPEYRPTSRVLIAYNGSMESAKAMKRFIQLAPWPDVTIKVACFGFDDDKAEELLAGARAYCHAHGHVIETESLRPYPTEGLLAHARHWNADLVVLGATSRSKIAKLILGDTVLHVMQSAEIPLFLGR
jgi:nucleotide-binding universal stress UspA family protein